MRLVCISDTHQLHCDVHLPHGDVLVCAGDFCSRGTLAEADFFAQWLVTRPHKYKVVVAGNHDMCFENPKLRAAAEGLFEEEGVHYLRDSGIEIEGVKFYGSPWQPEFYDWAFNLSRLGPELRDFWDRIPSDTNVLVTHGPPHGILDETPSKFNPRFRKRKGPLENVGCELLRSRVDQLSQLGNLKAHIFGHIHYSHGTVFKDGVQYINAACCTEQYKPLNVPRVFEL